MDWECECCSYNNSDILEYCEICDYPKIILYQTNESNSIINTNTNTTNTKTNPNDLNGNDSNFFSQSLSYWICQHCEYKFNMYDENICLMCDKINENLPPTYMLLRRQLLRDWNHGKSLVEIFKHNIIVYRNCLDTDTQILLLNDCRDKLNRISMPGMASKTKPGPTHGYSYQTGWVGGQPEDKKEGDPSCLELATNLHSNLISELHDEIVDINAIQKNNLLHIPDKFKAHSLWARQYTSSQGLGFHLDPPNCEWAFIISLGADTCFQVYGEHEKENDAIDIVLKSGDAIFFNGSHVYHGIKDIISGTEPKWWNETEYSRVGLQMRGHLGISVSQRNVLKPKRQYIKKPRGAINNT